jgi:hypothetical protein
MNEPVTILYIGGHGRSGSTILAQTLAQLPDFVNVGELWHVWHRGLREEQLCGCGRPFYSCEFWRAVGDEAFGGWDNVDAKKMSAFRPILKRLRYAPHYALAAKTGIRTREISALLVEFAPSLERLYYAIQRVSGARVILDSSKHLPYALLLGTLPLADLRVLHLVRDSRAVAHSWARRKARTEIVGQRVLMPRLSPVQASRAWSLQNYSYSFLARFNHLWQLRYEDFVDDPAFYLGGALSRLGLRSEADGARALLGREVSLSVDHTVSGNPGRFRTGTMELRSDERWKAEMKSADKNVVTSLTAPLLLKYGYLEREKKAK